MYDYLKYIYLSNKYKANDLEWLYNNNIVLIINTTDEIPNFFENKFTYFNLNLKDEHKTILYPFLDNIKNTLDGYINRECNVLIHSNFGKSRSVAILIYYIMEKEKCSLRKALKIIGKIYGHSMGRSDHINKSFLFQLNSISPRSISY